MTDSHEHRPADALVIRPFQNADAPAVARLVTDSVRGHWTYGPERFKESPDPQRRRLVAVNGAEVIATAHFSPFGNATPDALRLDLAGDGAAFTPLYLAHLADLPPGFSRLLGVTHEDFIAQMDFFHAAGFRNAWQSWGAHLDLRDFDFAIFQPLEERLFLKGYEVGQLSNDAPDVDWDALFALHERGLADAPRNPTTTPEPLNPTELREIIVDEETVSVARWHGEIVAFVRLTPREREVESENTVTHPDHRSRGLATLVGARALAWARAEGYAAAGTGGTVLNLPMLRVNTRLGYRVERMWVTWVRALT
ncbi:GNAT family N-acetyltransferase [Deinococcus arenicola]|uniref:GNAT family N-acetyltransferase n=1 Tax=Deinococcus arenicola TaxID=2994950 RepID=A0ABU4DP99_9DEIO|nr:GNAT family N-acetyltransferase [Deinococcus sp. ZS9-10]MDV6374253.1 GNAT family N-acetyltransferase [Deinococcus sp. ZS9-10]